MPRDTADEQDVAPGQRLLLTAGCCLCFFSFAFVYSLLGAGLPVILRDRGYSSDVGGGLFSAYILGVFLCLLPGGVLCDRLGRKPVAYAGSLMVVFGALLCAASPSALVFVLGMFLVGGGGGFLEDAANALTADIHPRHLSATLSLIHSCYTLGLAAGPYAMGWFLDSGHRWETAFVAGAAIGLSPLVCLLPTVTPAAAGHDVVDLARVRKVFSTAAFWIPSTMLVLYVVGELATQSWTVTYFAASCRLPTSAAARIMSGYWIIIVASRIGFGLAGRHARVDLLLPLCGAAAGGMLAAAFTMPTAPLARPLLYLSAVAMALLFPLIISTVYQRMPEVFASVSGAVIATGTILAAPVPWLIGHFRPEVGLRPSLIACGVCVFAISVIAVLFPTSRRDPHTP